MLEWKGVKYEYVSVNLLKSEHSSPEYVEMNPSGLVPALVLDDGTVMSQSVAIMEYLEEIIPDHPLLPIDPKRRALVRQAVNIIAGDTQPLQNLRVMRAFGDQGEGWAYDVIGRGLRAFLLAIVNKHAGLYCIGDTVTFADVVLVPQLYNARRFKVDMSEFVKLVEIEERLMQIPAFQMAAPDKQPDCPSSSS